MPTATLTSTNTGAASKSSLSRGTKIGVFTLAIMNVTAVVSLRGLPSEAEYGLSSIFYYIFAAIFFLPLIGNRNTDPF